MAAVAPAPSSEGDKPEQKSTTEPANKLLLIETDEGSKPLLVPNGCHLVTLHNLISRITKVPLQDLMLFQDGKGNILLVFAWILIMVCCFFCCVLH